MSEPPTPKVVCIQTREAYEAKPKRRRKPRINPELVKALEHLLERARSGEVTAVSYVAFNPKTNDFSFRSVLRYDEKEQPHQQAIRHIGALETLRFFLIDEELCFSPVPTEDHEGDRP